MRLENRESLAKKREDAKAAMKQPKHRILVCAGTGCLAGDSQKSMTDRRTCGKRRWRGSCIW